MVETEEQAIVLRRRAGLGDQPLPETTIFNAYGDSNAYGDNHELALLDFKIKKAIEEKCWYMREEYLRREDKESRDAELRRELKRLRTHAIIEILTHLAKSKIDNMRNARAEERKTSIIRKLEDL